MCRLLAAACLMTVVLGVCAGAVDPDLPSAAPKIAGVFPHGARRGSTTAVEMSGQNLQDVTEIHFAGRGVESKITAASPSKISLLVQVAPDAETGRRDFRLRTGRGAYVGVFDIGSLPEIAETENNDDWRKPQTIPLPILVNGIIGNEDWDHFRFQAQAGETIVCDVSSARHGSRLDADLAILDAAGEELAWVDDTTIFAEPHLEFTLPKTGWYVVRVGSLAGGTNSDYRLTVGKLPYVRRTLPAGLGAGSPALVTLSGVHLDDIDDVWIGDHAIRGEVLEKAASEARVRFQVPAGFTPGTYKLHVASKGLEVALPTVVRVSNLAEKTVGPAPSNLGEALSVKPGTVLNGVIAEPRATHYFRFHAGAGDTFLFQAESMKLGYHLDPALTLLDESGRKLAFADDPGTDDRSDEYQLDFDLSYRFETEGNYYIALRDAMYRGGEQLVYRLTVEQKAPDFLVEIREPVKTLYSGQDGAVQVRVRRRATWNTPIEVWAEALPEGVTSEKRIAEPKNSIVKDTCGVDREIAGTIVMIPIHAGASKPSRSAFRVRARGVMNGRTVEHTAIVRYENAAAGFTYGPMEEQIAEMTVVPPPAVLLSVPDKLMVSAGKEAELEVGVRRFGRGKTGSLRLRLSGDGFETREKEVPEGSKNVLFTLSGDLPAASLKVEALDSNGQLMGEAPTVLLLRKNTHD